MASSDQTIQVLDLSPKVTAADLNTFFSYCGTVDKILLERKEDQSQVAYVTFRQPFARQTALLLNGAFILDSRVRILALRKVPIIQNTTSMTKQQQQQQGIIPAAQSLAQILALIGYENLNKAKEMIDEKYYKISEKGMALGEKARMSIAAAAEQTVGRVGEEIVNNERFSAGALWVSAALEKAAKCAADLGSHHQNKRNNPNSGKQK
ncbi:hypothetical protein ACHQM5_025960 [Ranunculus cassubicifolius]